MLNFDAASALEYLRRAEALAADDADILIAKAQANLMLQRSAAARQAAARAVEIDAEEPTARLVLGWAYLFGKDLPQAERAFGEALRLDPQQADAEAGLALIAVARNEHAGAREALRRAKRIDPANPAVLLTEGALAQKQGNPDLAKRVLEELMSANALGQSGWTNRELMERQAQSATVRRVTQKWTRYMRREHRARARTGGL
jgi:Tfp pilus assembly protein PilF